MLILNRLVYTNCENKSLQTSLDNNERNVICPNGCAFGSVCIIIKKELNIMNYLEIVKVVGREILTPEEIQQLKLKYILQTEQ